MIDLLSCREVASLLTEYLEQTIPWEQRIRTSMHLQLCPGCRRLLEDLGLLPALVSRFEPPMPLELAPIGDVALKAALQRLGEVRSSRRLPMTPVPSPIRALLSSVVDLPLRLLAQTHAAILRDEVPHVEPFLPDAVLAQLPPVQTWKWRHFPGGLRKALLWTETSGPTLSLVFMPAKYVLASHTHQGSESLLILEGELEQGTKCHTSGDWIHMESGSSHAPCAFGRGCWCLVRDEGSIHFAGPFGWFRGLMAGA
jgi:putative transcriptional regulator